MASASVWSRLWAYQAERFPLAPTTLLLMAFVAAGVSVSAALGGRAAPALWIYAAMLFATLTIFFQLRAADERKDLADDRLYRPERPIPRGLVSLELILGLALALAPLAALASWLVASSLLWLLLAVWVWLGLMTAEFFAPSWLKRRPFVYALSHMLVMPLVALLVTGAEWMAAGARPDPALGWFWAAGFGCGAVLEVGRKIRAPSGERAGVETYSALLGPSRAILLWLVCVAGMACCLAALVRSLDATVAIGLALAPILAAGAVAWRFLRAPSDKSAAWIDRASGLLILASYSVVAALGLAGAAP